MIELRNLENYRQPFLLTGLLLLFSFPCWAERVITTFAGLTWKFVVQGTAALEAPLGAVSGLAVDSDGNVFVADKDNHIVAKILPSGTLIIVAGNGAPGFSGDGGPATLASLYSPQGIRVDSQGNLYIADRANRRVRKVSPDGIIVTIAGGGPEGLRGDGGPATIASLAGPADVALDSTGNLFIADHGIRKVAPDGTITTFAYQPNVCGGLVCPQPPGPLVYGPSAIAVDSAGNLYVANSQGPVERISPAREVTVVSTESFYWAGGMALDPGGSVYVSDTFFHRIRILTPDGTTRIIGAGVRGFLGDGGSAAAAYFHRPTGLVLDAGGNLYVADSLNGRVRRIDAAETISTIAGNGKFKGTGDGGLAVRAALNSPHGISVDGSGYVYIADSGNHRLRRVTPEGTITTVAGSGAAGYRGDDGPATDAWLWEPYAATADPQGSVLIADRMNNRVRKIDAHGRIRDVAGNGNAGFAGDGGPATLADLAYPVGLAFDPAGNLYIATQSEITPLRRVGTADEISSVFGTPRTPPPPNFIPNAIAWPDSNYGIAVDREGNLFFSHRYKHQVSRLSPLGVLTVIAGNGKAGFSGDGGPATEASLNQPQALSVDAKGSVYVVDRGNRRIRKVDTTGTITTVAGNGEQGLPAEGAPATGAALGDPYAVAIGPEGDLFIADPANDRIWKVSEETARLTEPLMCPDGTEPILSPVKDQSLCAPDSGPAVRKRN